MTDRYIHRIDVETYDADETRATLAGLGLTITDAPNHGGDVQWLRIVADDEHLMAHVVRLLDLDPDDVEVDDIDTLL